MPNVPQLAAPLVSAASKSANSEVDPFWRSDSEGVPEEGMYQLATELDFENPDELLDHLPRGYRIVHSIFLWEQSRAGEGFVTGTANSGTQVVHAAADAYDEIGFTEEAAALRSMLAQLQKTPAGYDEVSAAYDSVQNPYRNDWDRIPPLVRRLCEQASSLFEVEA